MNDWFKASDIDSFRYCPHAQREFFVSPHMGYIVQSFIWCFVSECCFISDNYLVSNVIVVAHSCFIFTCIIFINWHLLLLTYEIPMGDMFNWKYHITTKYQLVRAFPFYSMIRSTNQKY